MVVAFVVISTVVDLGFSGYRRVVGRYTRHAYYTMWKRRHHIYTTYIRPLLLLYTSFAVLYCCNTWWVGGSLRGRHCCTTFCCTAVSRWVDRFVAETMLPLCCYILRSITINSGTLKNYASAWPVLLEKTEKQLEQQQQQQQPSGEGCCFSYSYT